MKSKKNDAAKAKFCLILWIIIYCLIFAFAITAKAHQALVTGVSGNNPTGIVEQLTFLFIAVALLPLSFMMRHYARKAELTVLKIIATFLSALLTFWCSGMLIAYVREAFFLTGA